MNGQDGKGKEKKQETQAKNLLVLAAGSSPSTSIEKSVQPCHTEGGRECLISEGVSCVCVLWCCECISGVSGMGVKAMCSWGSMLMRMEGCR